jgi:sec-independent protein translocase protein TatC
MSNTPPKDSDIPYTLEEMPITQHLIILRRHLIKIIAILLLLFFCLLPFANESYQLLSAPLRAQLPVSSSMIATDVTATFMAPFKLNFFVALMLSMPFIIYQLWAFIKPALYEKEKSLAVPLLLGSIFMFYTGIAFAYFIALPSILHFFISVSPDSVAPMT